MKYIFFHRDRFADGSLWIIIDSKKPKVAKIRSTDGSLTTHNHITLENCIDLVRGGMWEVGLFI